MNTEMATMQAPSSEKAVSVLVAHRHSLIRGAIASVLADAGFELIGEVDTPEALRRVMAQSGPPGIILLDWELADGNPDPIQSIIKDYPDSTVVVLTRPLSQDAFKDVMQVGPGGYLSVNISPDELINSLRMIARGNMIISREVSQGASQWLRSSRRDDPLSSLSEREKEVLCLIGQGATNREIASSLIITENTVKVHLRNILDKLNLRNRQQAAAFAAQEGLVDDMQPRMSRLTGIRQ